MSRSRMLFIVLRTALALNSMALGCRDASLDSIIPKEGDQSSVYEALNDKVTSRGSMIDSDGEHLHHVTMA